MNKKLEQLKKWYAYRITRERILLLLLGWAIIYAFFHLIFFRPLQKKADTLRADIKTAHEQIDKWDEQLNALTKISTTPLYKQWLSQNQLIQNMQGRYQTLIQPFSQNKWQETIQTVLQTQAKIIILEIKSASTSIYTPANTTEPKTSIFEQKLQISFAGSFFDVVDYLEKLEHQLPDVHWIHLNYEVIKYPQAKVEVEFSIFYE